MHYPVCQKPRPSSVLLASLPESQRLWGSGFNSLVSEEPWTLGHSGAILTSLCRIPALLRDTAEGWGAGGGKFSVHEATSFPCPLFCYLGPSLCSLIKLGTW